MDYEKKYNEALERLQALHRDYDNISNLVDVKRELESIFPELRESEDERIMRCIGLALTDVNEQRFNDFGITLKDCLSWLEKQKEIPMPNSTELIEMWHKAKAILNEKDFRGDEWRLAQNAFMGGFARGTCVKSEKQKEQKPAEWSEENDATIKSAVHWLEKYLSTIGAKDVSSATQDGILTVKVTITNLKSLRPRPSWKPSDEQMEALMLAIEGKCLPTSYMSRRLEDLYEQLEKL